MLNVINVSVNYIKSYSHDKKSQKNYQLYMNTITLYYVHYYACVPNKNKKLHIVLQLDFMTWTNYGICFNYFEG